MAFYLRIIWVVLALIIVPPYSALPEFYRIVFPITGIVLFVAVLVWVAFLNYRRPKLLLYGEKTHFEEWKYERKQAGSSQNLASRGLDNEVAELSVTDQ